MFRKLIGKLPFNPSLISRITEYQNKLMKDQKIRLAGFLFVLIATIAHVTVFVAPPGINSSASPNDLLIGGITNSEEAFIKCLNNFSNYQNFLKDFGITCDNIRDSKNILININDFNNELTVAGRTFYPLSNQVEVHSNQATYWLRYLGDVTTGYTSDTSLAAINGTTNDGIRFFILNNSGNPVFIGSPDIVSKDLIDNQKLAGSGVCTTTKCFELSHKVRNQSRDTVFSKAAWAKSGEIVIYSLHIKNLSGRLQTDYKPRIEVSDLLDYSEFISASNEGFIDNRSINWPGVDLAANNVISRTFTMRIKSPQPKTPVSLNHPGTYDSRMDSFFGNSVSVNIDNGLIKGIGNFIGISSSNKRVNLIINLIVVAVILYSYLYVRLLTKELRIIRKGHDSA